MLPVCGCILVFVYLVKTFILAFLMFNFIIALFQLLCGTFLKTLFLNYILVSTFDVLH